MPAPVPIIPLTRLQPPPPAPRPSTSDGGFADPNWQRWFGQLASAVQTFVVTYTQPYAPLASPTFTGNPQAPTPAPGDSDGSLATTRFVTLADGVILDAAEAYADSKVEDTIVNGVTAKAPSQNAVFDALVLKQDKSEKDASSGYAGLTGLSVNLWNAAGTFKSTIGNANTAGRAYSLQDRDGTLADGTDLAGKADKAGLTVVEGSDKKQGVATLSGGTVVVANASVTANSRIFCCAQSGTTTLGALGVSARTPGTSFTILSSDPLDARVVAYEIFEPA